MAYTPGFGYLNNPYMIFTDYNGGPLSNGTVATYIAGTTTPYITLKDWNGTYNEAVIPLDINGGCTIIAPSTQGLKLVVKDHTGLLYKTFDNVFVGGANSGYLPGTTVIRVDGTDGEIISVGTPDPSDPNKIVYTISLDSEFVSRVSDLETQVASNTTMLDNSFVTNIAEGDNVVLEEVVTPATETTPELKTVTVNSKLSRTVAGQGLNDSSSVIGNNETITISMSDEDIVKLGSINDMILGTSNVRDFPMLADTSRAIKICSLTRTTAVGWSVNFKVHFVESNEIIQYVGSGIGDNSDNAKVNYLSQTIPSAWIGSLAVIHSKWVDNVSSFYLVSPTWTAETEKIQGYDGKFSGTGMIVWWDNDAYIETPSAGFIGHEDFLIKPVAITSTDGTVTVAETTPIGGTQTFNLHVNSMGEASIQDRGEWEIGIDYKLNNFVTSNDIIYICMEAYTSVPDSPAPASDSTHWKLFIELNSSEISHISTGDSLGAKDIIQLQAGSSTQWSAHAAMCSPIGAITPNPLSKMGFIATQVVAGNFIIAAYKVETNLAHSLICATGVTALPASAGWINTPVLNYVKSIAANDRVYLVVMTDSNGVAMAGASCTTFNIQPYVSGIKTNMGVLTEAPATLTFDSETTSRPFIYMVK